MNIDFIAPFQGKKQLGTNYKFINKLLSDLGHKVQDNHLFDLESDDLKAQDNREPLKYFKYLTTSIKKADILVVEVTCQRISSGYFIALAMEMGKPVIALQTGDDVSHVLGTLESYEKFSMYHYRNLEDLAKELPLLLDFAAEQQDTRFNFFISPKHQHYLDWISKNKKIPRSVYLRDLIEKDLDNQDEYQNL